MQCDVGFSVDETPQMAQRLPVRQNGRIARLRAISGVRKTRAMESTKHVVPAFPV